MPIYWVHTCKIMHDSYIILRRYIHLEGGSPGSRMSIDIGSTVDGTIIKLAEYGAIVRLQDGKTGLIHISEIADTFVRDVKDYFKEHDRVKVKVLSLNSKGRYELSTKHVEQPVPEVAVTVQRPRPAPQVIEPVNLGPDSMRSWEKHQGGTSFEDQMSRFLKDSQERLLDLKRNIECKRGIKRR